MRRKYLIGLATIGVAVGGVLAASATLTKEKATGVVALRQATMKANAAHMTALKKISTEYPQLLGQALFHAEAIEKAVAYVPDMFPPGSDQPPTAALPAVWGDQTGFKAAAARAADRALDLSPGYFYARFLKVAALVRAGRWEEAARERAAFEARHPDFCIERIRWIPFADRIANQLLIDSFDAAPRPPTPANSDAPRDERDGLHIRFAR